VFIPTEMKRRSPSDEESSMVRASGSLSTPSPSAREMPCFFRFVASLVGPKVLDIHIIYAQTTPIATPGAAVRGA
jgi:hypothetical protein